jgi:hypothetical protein
MNVWNNLTPRWKATALSALAQLDARKKIGSSKDQQQKQIPWIDAILIIKSQVQGTPVPKVVRYERYLELGVEVATDEIMSLCLNCPNLNITSIWVVEGLPLGLEC